MKKALRKFARMQKIIPLKFQGEKLLLIYKKERTKLTISQIITETASKKFN